ncbi:hypothetical protein HOI18_04360 [Candidatus Uhrbacteria bacterium]|jgi:hypothetical protein|nr:hypothetical protein [Candidatus Uhrbacteria bacterium]
MINLATHPPTRWVIKTAILKYRVRNTALASVMRRRGRSSEISEVSDDDLGLAVHILLDEPTFLHGANEMNQYGHGGWAMQVVGDLDGAWNLLNDIYLVGERLLEMHAPISIPTETLFVLVFTAMRLNKLPEAALVVRMLHEQRGHHKNLQTDDFAALKQQLGILQRQALSV